MPNPSRQSCLCAALLTFCLIWLSAGCATPPDGGRWGQGVKLWPGGDRNLTHWAANNRPIISTQQAADNASYYLVDALLGTYVITGLATPSGDKPGEWAWNKIKAFSVEAAAVGLTDLSTEGHKSAVGRERPDGSSNKSFPSSTSSAAAVYGSLATQNLNYLNLPRWADISLRGGTAT